MIEVSDKWSVISGKNKLFCFLFSILCLLFSQLPAPSSQLVKKILKDKKVTDEKKEPEEKKEPIKESEFEPILIGALLDNPKNFLEKKIKFRGKFSSFTTLALDYEPAMRKSKDYISLTIFRSNTKIPLSELKMAYPVKEAKEDKEIRELEEGDLLEVYGKVFSSALDEPWVDIVSLKKLESAKKTTNESATKKDEEDKTLKTKEKKSKSKKDKK